MPRTPLSLALGVALAASTLAAQPPRSPIGPPRQQGGPGRLDAPRPDGPPLPGRMPNGVGPRLDPAAMLLAHTGELRLTDAQVVKLAALARRADERRRAMRARVDSLRPAPGQPQPTAPPPERRAEEDRMRDQAHADLRDALAVLNADQQAQAFELAARRP